MTGDFFLPLLLSCATLLAWMAWQRVTDRRLFTAEAGRSCANLHAAEAAAFLRDHPDTQVLDVRSPHEFAAGALPGAVNVSVGDPEFDRKVGALDRSRPVLVYCAGGSRSRKAVPRLKALDFETIRHLHRGYLSWKSRA